MWRLRRTPVPSTPVNAGEQLLFAAAATAAAAAIATRNPAGAGLAS